MKVAIVTSPAPEAIEGAYSVKAWLSDNGVQTHVWSANSYDGCDSSDPLFSNDAKKVRESELVVAFGGDGTCLRAARLVGYSEIPILSFNFGHLGFLTSSDNSRMIERLSTVLACEVSPRRHMTLNAKVFDWDGNSWSCFALNEAVIARGSRGHLIPFSASINGQKVMQMRGDGVICSTATGSTAYSLSAGGPIVSPAYRGVMTVPIACHTLTSRPVLGGPADTVEIELSETTPENPVLFIDGQVHGCVPRYMEVSPGKGDVLLYRFEENDFYHTLATTFFGMRDA